MRKEIKKVKYCRVCASKKLYKFLDFGDMPLPNKFLKKKELNLTENKYKLATLLCKNCGLVQLSHVVNPKIMFEDYLYIPSTSKVMLNNFNSLAYQAKKTMGLGEKSFVIDIGSNDGTLLTLFKLFNCKVLGIDPAKNLAKLANRNGVRTITKQFNQDTASYVVEKYGKADLVTATNVVAHIDKLDELLKGISHLLKKKGIFITEFPYLMDLITKNQFDTIYHEHLSYFSLKPWRTLTEKYGFVIKDVRKLLIHGGSIRLVNKRREGKKKFLNKTLDYLISLEEKHGLYKKSVYDVFSKNILKLRSDLKTLLKKLKKDNKRIVGYGAAAKGNVLTNFFDIGTETLDYTVDSTPYKQGLFTPGKHIPIFPEDKLIQDQPDYALILAWNFADEIISKQRQFREKGGRFIIPIPEVKII